MSDSNDNLYWLLGTYFLYRFYSVFDMSTAQVGLAMSKSYNWTGYIDPILFNNSMTTETSMPTVTIANEVTYTSTSTLSSIAVINKNTFVKNMLSGSSQIFLIFLMKTI